MIYLTCQLWWQRIRYCHHDRLKLGNNERGFMSDSLRIALVGCGAIAEYHLKALKSDVPRAKVTACVDSDIEKAKTYGELTGGRVFSSVDEALADGDFDAVDIMLPHDLHETIAIQCLNAGKHVLLEKPIAPTIEASERILKVANQSDRVFMVAENSQYWPEIVKAKQLIENGQIGEIITARAAFIYEFDSYWFKETRPWRYEKERTGGGIAIDGGSHWIRPLRMWLGEIEEVVGTLGHPLKQMEGESLARALFRFDSGAIAQFDAMMIDTIFAPDPWWRITGSKGEITIQASLDGSELWLWTNEHREGKKIFSSPGYTASFGGELADFTEAVLDRKPLAAKPEFALGELRTALALYRSAESRHWEKVWE